MGNEIFNKYKSFIISRVIELAVQTISGFWFIKDAKTVFPDLGVAIKKNNPEKINKNGYYEKDMLKWVRSDKLKDFNKQARPWYKSVIRLLIKYVSNINLHRR